MGDSRWIGAVALVGAFLVRPARAEPPSLVPPLSLERAVPIPIEMRGSEPHLRLEIQDPETRRTLAFCDGACQWTLVPGRYRFFADATADTRAGGREVEILQASQILVTPRNESRYATGLALGITGSALTLLGAVLFLTNPGGGSSSELGTGDGALAGLGMMVAGLTLTPIGWVMFGTSFRPKVEVTPLRR
jgi:hypothetical protein